MSRIVCGDIVTGYEYDADGRYAGTRVSVGGNVISDIRYGYDDKGNCIKKANVADGINAVTEYRYDGIGRITGVNGPDISESYAYDRAGNRVSRMTDRGITESYRYNEVNELLSVGCSRGDGEVNEVREFTYDADGNMTSDGSGIYKYDSMNRMAEAVMEDGRKLICRYDAEGLRHETEENGRLIKFIYSGRDAVCDEDEESVTRYIRGNGRLVASDSEQARTYYHYACDSLGSVSHVIAGDEFGSEEENADIGRRVLCRYEYDAFGNTVSAEENVTSRYGFAGEMRDGITGQYYLRARYYVPEIGRFTQVDTYHGDGLNLYVYARNNPVKYVDHSVHNSKGIGVDSSSNSRLILGTEGVVTGGDSTVLGENMFIEMGLDPNTSRAGYQAQHIIPKELKEHPILQKIGMDLDDASNVMFLRERNLGEISATSIHQGYHKQYTSVIKEFLDNMEVSKNVPELEREVYNLQQSARNMMQDGTPIYMCDHIPASKSKIGRKSEKIFGVSGSTRMEEFIRRKLIEYGLEL
ncbi:MAG: hypothetical protein HDT39_00075 [Lachnospiraceae bacterium]|nr:hypothetical protein [Lachnospiraceae bacterium]